MDQRKYLIGFTQGTFDMFHIGHLNIIKNARSQCEHLIVGVNSDALVQDYKNKIPVINEKERAEIVANVKGVERVIITHTLDKVEMWKELHFDAVFIGDDWKGNSRWETTIRQLQACGAEVVFLPHTDGISSTILRIEKDGAVDGE